MLELVPLPYPCLGKPPQVFQWWWDTLGELLGPSWLLWGPLGVLLGALGALLGALGALLGRSWALLGRSWALWGRSWAALGPLLGASWRSWVVSWRSWALLGRSWDVLGAFWAAPGPLLGRSWGHLGALLAPFPLVKNALADMVTNFGRGRFFVFFLEVCSKIWFKMCSHFCFRWSECAFFPPARGGCAKHPE